MLPHAVAAHPALDLDRSEVYAKTDNIAVGTHRLSAPSLFDLFCDISAVPSVCENEEFARKGDASDDVDIVAESVRWASL